ncbi:MAG: DUF2851 family protein [Saprospiraceae bacterium]|nr:DUF2851 family protein [Saprospiraceae bacterium]
MPNHLPSRIKEETLYYIWKTKQFDHQGLSSTAGARLKILSPGSQNFDSGPDFSDARIEIDGTLWAGHIEMHVKASDWIRHGHEGDPNYENTILHVVYENDKDIQLAGGTSLHCLELKTRIETALLERCHALVHGSQKIPCSGQLDNISPLVTNNWLDRVATARLQDKMARLTEILAATNFDWEETFYQLLLRSFGFKTNAEAFHRLSVILPRSILLKHKNSIRQIEALLYGQAGMLSAPSTTNTYVQKLTQEYTHLAHKHGLQPMPDHVWKYMRMRPANFPTIRIAQFAVLFFRTNHLFSKMLAAANYKELSTMFASEVSEYWKSHYRFGEESERRSKRLGKMAIQLLVINTVVPMMFYYGKHHNQQPFCDKALKLLEELPAESNKISRKFAAIGLPAQSALHSQALIHLMAHYCTPKRCLRCGIGNAIVAS